MLLGISQLVMILLAIGTTTTIYIVHQLSITTNIMNRSIIYCIKASPILELFNSRFFLEFYFLLNICKTAKTYLSMIIFLTFLGYLNILTDQTRQIFALTVLGYFYSINSRTKNIKKNRHNTYSLFKFTPNRI